MDKYYSIKEVAAISGFSLSTIYKKTSQRAISFKRPFKRKIFFTQGQIEEFMGSCTLKTKKEIEEESINYLKGI